MRADNAAILRRGVSLFLLGWLYDVRLKRYNQLVVENFLVPQKVKGRLPQRFFFFLKKNAQIAAGPSDLSRENNDAVGRTRNIYPSQPAQCADEIMTSLVL